jgi:hypothetical protein
MSKAKTPRPIAWKSSRGRARAHQGHEIGLRQAAQALVLIIPFLALIVLGSGYLFPKAQSRQPQPPDRSEEYRNRIGSILFTPTNGSAAVCEERLFDNLTGKLVADGFIDCTFQQPAERPDSMRHDKSAERMRAVFEAFKK